MRDLILDILFPSKRISRTEDSSNGVIRKDPTSVSPELLPIALPASVIDIGTKGRSRQAGHSMGQAFSESSTLYIDTLEADHPARSDDA
ncbi:MAG: hypothetical protein CMJ47_04875 [Planctomyces sp.]|nr:hypothetical protein [Planctomyces sp.]